MKTLLCVWTLFAIALVRADDFKTVDGKEYKNVTVSRAEPDGIVVVTDSGIVKLYFAELPKEIREKYHYDPEKAAAFSSAAAEQQRALNEAVRSAKEEQTRNQNEYWRTHPGPSDPYTQGGSLYSRVRIVGEVVDQMKDGRLVILSGETEDKESSHGVVLLRGHPNVRMIAPGDRVDVHGSSVGTIQYKPPYIVWARLEKFLGPVREGGITIHAYDFSP